MAKDKQSAREKNKTIDSFKQEVIYNVTSTEMNADHGNHVVAIDNQVFDKTYNTEEGFNS